MSHDYKFRSSQKSSWYREMKVSEKYTIPPFKQTNAIQPQEKSLHNLSLMIINPSQYDLCPSTH